MSVKIFKGKDKEISKLLMELCEKYYEGPSMDKTYETLTIDSNLDEEMSNDDLWAYNFSGVTDKLYVSLAGEFNIEVTAPLSDWYVDRRFKNEKEKRAVYSNFSMYGGCDMSFAEAVRCIIERRNRDFRYDRNERKAVKSPIDEEVLIELDELYESGEHVNEYEEKLFDDYDKQNYDTGLENEENSCFEIVNGTLKKCITQQEEVIVPDSVTSIGDGAFSECESIRKVSIPHSVISIGSHAFSECPNLEEVIIPNSVTSIGMYAFSCCANLEKIIIPNSVTSIGLCAFNECLSLEEVTIPESVTIIGGRAFSDTKWLDDYPDDFVIVNNNLIKYNGKEKNVIIPDNVKIINEAAFHYCSTPISITIPGSVEFIERDAFSDCNNLTTVTIPESVTFIGPRAFAGCKNLKHVTLPNSVTSISGWLFENCLQLASITIPYSVTNIGIYAFDNCENLNSITIKNIKFKADLKKLSNDFEKAKKMIETKDFTVKISGSLKYVFIIDHYLQTKDEECRKYIQKNILKIIKWLIDDDNNDIISNLIVTGDFVDAKNLDKFLDYANETYKTEIANIFIEYKTKL